MFWIHLNVDYPFNLTGVLYFPKIKQELELQRNKIKLFSRQVFITDEVKDIVPEFLMLLHGVIDSPDIPLNVSRSFLQADSNVKKINNYITKKVADRLNDLFKKDREQYEAKWQDIGLFVKYGMVSDEKFYDKAKDFALLTDTDNKHSTIVEYSEKAKALQTDKQGNIVLLYTNDAEKHHPYVQRAKDQGYSVLLMDSPIDLHFINQMEQKLEKTHFKRVDADIMSKLIEKDEAIAHVLTEDEASRVKGIFEQSIATPTMTVSVESLNPEDMPVMVTMDEFMRRMKEMSKVSGGMSMYGMLPDNYKITVNGNHKLIDRILKTEDEGKRKQLAKHALDIALLSQGMLTGAALTEFLNRSVTLIDA